MARKTTRIRQQSPPAGRRCRVGHRCRRQEGPAERVRSSFLSPVREHRQLDTDDVAAAGTDSAESDRSASNSTLSSSPVRVSVATSASAVLSSTSRRDRQRVVYGKRGSLRVDICGYHILKK